MERNKIARVLYIYSILASILGGLFLLVFMPQEIGMIAKNEEFALLKWPGIIGIYMIAIVCFYAVYRFFFDDPNIVKVQNINSSSYYVLKNNGTVYDYNIKKERWGIQLLSTNTVYTSENLGSKIVDFNYAGDESEATFVRTENKIFRNEALNRKDCREYIDVDCQFEFAEDATLTKYYDRILAYNGTTLITDYLKVFRVGGEVKEDEEEEEE